MGEVYDVLLVTHSFVRWLVLAACALTALRSFRSARAERPWTARDQRFARGFVASVDLQVLLGMSLYFGVSPLARVARALWSAEGFAALWAQPMLRFVGVIHPSLALVAATTAHVAWVAARRTLLPSERHARLAWGAALALAAFLAAVPWPFLGHERPWVRF